MPKETYAGAGVDIDAAARIKTVIGRFARSTFNQHVMGDFGYFGGLFDLKGYPDPVLVSHSDGVGTKLKVALAVGKHDTIGIDIVNHCVNDIFTCGAEPLFFQDYIGMGKLEPDRVKSIVQGIAHACHDVGCVLIGGETAEMPGVYAGEDYDLVGFIVGGVSRRQLIDGKGIKKGDAVIGLPSSGLHTNGFSLVRKIFTLEDYSKYYPGLGRTLGEALLEPHRCYYHVIKPLLPMVSGLAHITGGSFAKNIGRILPPGLAARLDSRAWAVPPLFEIIQQRGEIEKHEMYRVFNMGIGMCLVCDSSQASALTGYLKEARIIGEITDQSGKERVNIE